MKNAVAMIVMSKKVSAPLRKPSLRKLFFKARRLNHKKPGSQVNAQIVPLQCGAFEYP